MRRVVIILAALVGSISASAQTTMEQFLAAVEAGNPTLQAAGEMASAEAYSAQKREALETELQNAHGELKSTLRQLQELRDVLQKAQLSLEEKYTTIKDLTAELR